MATKIKFGSPAWRAKYHLGTAKKKTKTRGENVARRRNKYFARAKRGVRRHARLAGIGGQGNLFQLDAMAYGAIRQKMENFVAPMVKQLPFGSANEEIALGVALWFGAKYLPPMLKGVAHKGLAIENYRIGEISASKFFGQGQTTSSSTATGFVYG